MFRGRGRSRQPMKKIFALWFLIAGVLASGLSIAADETPEQTVIRAGSVPSKAVGPEHFTGRVRTDQGFKSVAPARHYGASVTFEPGARTAWHIHPLGQTLIVTSGRGITQEWGKQPTIILPGDVVVCPPGVKHWHGAAPQTAMTHLAIGENAPGMGAQWFDKVTDEEYAKAAEDVLKGVAR